MCLLIHKSKPSRLLSCYLRIVPSSPALRPPSRHASLLHPLRSPPRLSDALPHPCRWRLSVSRSFISAASVPTPASQADKAEAMAVAMAAAHSPPSLTEVTKNDLLLELRNSVHEMRMELQSQREVLSRISRDVSSLKSLSPTPPDESLLEKYVQLCREPKVPSWPEWTAFTEHLKAMGFFEAPELKRIHTLNIYEDSSSVKKAMISFASNLNLRFSVASLTRQNVEALAMYACQSFDKKTASAQKKLQMFFQLDEKALSSLNPTARASLIDVSRVIHGITVSALSQVDALPTEIKTTILDLLQEMTTLSLKSHDSESVLKSPNQVQDSNSMLEKVKNTKTSTTKANKVFSDVKVKNESGSPNLVKQSLKDEEIAAASQSMPHYGEPSKSNGKMGGIIKQQKVTGMLDRKITKQSGVSSENVIDYLDDIILSDDSDEESDQEGSSNCSLSDLSKSKDTSHQHVGMELKGRITKKTSSRADGVDNYDHHSSDRISRKGKSHGGEKSQVQGEKYRSRHHQKGGSSGKGKSNY